MTGSGTLKVGGVWAWTASQFRLLRFVRSKQRYEGKCHLDVHRKACQCDVQCLRGIVVARCGTTNSFATHAVERPLIHTEQTFRSS